MNKPFYIILFILLFCCKAKTQTNLLYNGDFEMYSSCPTNVTSPAVVPYEITKCLGWTAPTYGTSDYFNACDNVINGIVGVPKNQLGYQLSKSGSAYCGFWAFSYGGVAGCYSGQFWWEYIQGQFTHPLIANHTYSIGFYFSLANGSSLAVKPTGGACPG